MSNILPAHRVAAIATWLVGLGALIAAVEGTLPASWQNTALAIGALLTKAVVTLRFMSGAQKSEALAARRPPALISAGTGNTAAGSQFSIDFTQKPTPPPAPLADALAQAETDFAPASALSPDPPPASPSPA